uniref:Testis-expressed protein 2-like n=1 Tax=Gouania willdenowi TaxID=441366 RepID=A0A8C5GEI3_GOUWI
MEDSKLILSLDAHEEGPLVAFCKDKPQTNDLALSIHLDSSYKRGSQAPFLPHSPSSSPGSLADLAESSTDLLSTTSLVKSSSTELEHRESSSVRGKPLLSLVKSLSTEISWKAEPEDNLSKSDSKLHLHHRRQIAHPKTLEARPKIRGDPVPPVLPSNTSPTESFRSSALIAEFEDTRKKFSEAMQDPLSMFSKIIGDESSSSSKQARTSSGGDLPASQKNGSTEESDSWCRKRVVCDTPLRRLQNDSALNSSESLSYIKDQCQNISNFGVQPQNNSWEEHQRTYPWIQVPLPGSSVPSYWLLLVGFLTYVFFVVPLPSYVTGLAVGVACGFILGMMVVFMLAPRHSRSTRTYRDLHACKYTPMNADPRDGKPNGTLERWMNETQCYDAETFHPSITNSVYVTLDGTQLRLDYVPCANIPRWAAFDESPHEAVFMHSRTYNLTNSKVSLVPSGLARKRVWNKKYPICIALAEGEVGEEVGRLEEEYKEVKHSVCDQSPVILYLFGRTGREKEEWYQHFLSASRTETHRKEEDNVETSGEGEIFRNLDDLPDLPGGMKTTLLDYSIYMNQLIGSDSNYSPLPSPCKSVEGSPATSKKDCNWLNSLVGRIFWDFLREKYWTDLVAHKIQKKLGKIKLPYFMNELTLTDLDMGACLPRVLSTSKPTLDRRGLWLELELEYTSCLQMTLETKMNLCKLGKDVEDEKNIDLSVCNCLLTVCVIQELSPLILCRHTGGSASKKFLRFVDKIAKSKYFQKATENEYIRKKIAEVSNMPLLLCVEVLELSGCLVINIPPPPTDRIWYSFRVPPRLDLHVRPMLGEREVTFTHVTEWIEKKLQHEFQKLLVMPNMDDLYLPLMTSALDLYGKGNQLLKDDFIYKSVFLF